MAVDVGGVEERAPQLERPPHGAPRFSVVRGAVGVADVVAADRPGAEPDLAHRQPGAPQHALLHRSSFASASRSATGSEDRKSTRLNSSHQIISYAVFCLKKKKKLTYTEMLLALEQSETFDPLRPPARNHHP